MMILNSPRHPVFGPQSLRPPSLPPHSHKVGVPVA